MNTSELIPDSPLYAKGMNQLRGALSDNVDIGSFTRALDEMILISPLEEVLPGSWADRIIAKILWEEQSPLLLEKLDSILTRGPSIKGNKEYISTCIVLQKVNIIPTLCSVGAEANMDKSLMMYAYELLVNGVWPHLDLISPDFFVKAAEVSSVCSGIARFIFLFNEERYENKAGILSEELTEKILSLPFKEGLSVFYKRVLEQSWYYNSGPFLGKGGLALLIENDVFSFQELKKMLKPEFSPLLKELETELEFRKLENDTVIANRSRKGLRL